MGKLNAAADQKIREICGRYKDEKTPLMIILSDIQNEYGYIPLEVQEVVSEETGIPVAEIYGVVTFYSFFSLTPKGKYVIGCCLGTACYVKGGQQVIDFCAKSLVNEGDIVIAEIPSFIGGLNSFRSYNANLVGVPLENDGMNLDILEEIAKKQKIKQCNWK